MQVLMTSPSTAPWIAPLIAGLFAIAGVWIGSFLNQKSGFRQAHKQQMRELRIRSYAKLMGIKIPFDQAVKTNAEAKILCEYYDARFHLLGNREDLDEAKKQNDRGLGLIPQISSLRRDLSETLGEVQISFPQSNELSAAIVAVYKSPSIDIQEIRGQVPSLAALDEWKSKAFLSLSSTVNTEYSDKIQRLLDLLYPMTDRA